MNFTGDVYFEPISNTGDAEFCNHSTMPTHIVLVIPVNAQDYMNMPDREPEVEVSKEELRREYYPYLEDVGWVKKLQSRHK